MKTNKTILITISLLFGITFLLVSWISKPDNNWKAPASADKITNPIKGKITETEKGKKIYMQMCAICHGNKGKGDGIAGMSLKPRPSNFTSDNVQSQTDGAIFWKLTEGKAPMASYKTILKEEQRWQVVNYIRTFKK